MYQKELKAGPHKILHMDIYISFIYNCQNLKATKMSFSRWMWYIQIIGYYSALKWNELWRHEKTWKNLKHIFLRGRNQSEKMTYYIIPIIWSSRKWKIMETIGLARWLCGKESSCQCRNMCLTPGLERSGGGNGNSFSEGIFWSAWAFCHWQVNFLSKVSQWTVLVANVSVFWDGLLSRHEVFLPTWSSCLMCQGAWRFLVLDHNVAVISLF